MQAEYSEQFRAFTEQMRPLHGQIVLIHRADIAMLLGVGQDPYDFYYITRSITDREPVWHTAVGHIDALQPHLPPEIYDQMADIYKMNNIGTSEFLVLTDPTEY